MRENITFRIRVVFGIFLFCVAILIGRLFFIQITKGDHYLDLANRQYMAPTSGQYNRGTIYFQKKDGTLVSAATLKNGYVLAIKPELIEDSEEVYKKISEIIPSIDKEDFLNRASKKEDPYEEIIHKLTAEEAKKIQELEEAGVDVFGEKWRFYPANNLASRVLGFVGYKGNDFSGRYGLERAFEDVLKREDNKSFNINSFAEILGDIKEIITSDTKYGDVVLTIEPEAQTFLENILEEAVGSYNAELGGGLIIEPSTGKIVAMSVKPDFNPNIYGEAEDLSLFSNPMVQSIFEMGSIMKPLTMAAGLNEKVISPQTTYNDKGYVVFNNARIENYDGKARGVVDMQEVLSKSLNTGVVFVMEKMGKNKFKDYMISYGFGDRTGIELPGEISGLITNLESNRDIEFATASFGQGIAVTPIEMATALSSLANGGKLMRPYIVDRIIKENDIDIKTEPLEIRRVLSEETSKEISRMLSRVADEALANGTVKMERYTFGAKTGTAQMHKEDGTGYYEDEYLHSFFGYVPAFDAQFLTLLFLIKPQGVRYASQSLTDPFMSITKFLINYYNIPPDR